MKYVLIYSTKRVIRQFLSWTKVQVLKALCIKQNTDNEFKKILWYNRQFVIP